MTSAGFVTVYSSKAESNIPRRMRARRLRAAMYFVPSKAPSVNNFCPGLLYRGPQHRHPRSPTAPWFDRSFAAGANRSSEAMALLLGKTVGIR